MKTIIYILSAAVVGLCLAVWLQGRLLDNLQARFDAAKNADAVRFDHLCDTVGEIRAEQDRYEQYALTSSELGVKQSEQILKQELEIQAIAAQIGSQSYENPTR